MEYLYRFTEKAHICSEAKNLCVSYDNVSKQFVSGTHKYEFRDWNTHCLYSDSDLCFTISNILFNSDLIHIRVCADINGSINANPIKNKRGICII